MRETVGAIKCVIKDKIPKKKGKVGTFLIIIMNGIDIMRKLPFQKL